MIAIGEELNIQATEWRVVNWIAYVPQPVSGATWYVRPQHDPTHQVGHLGQALHIRFRVGAAAAAAGYALTLPLKVLLLRSLHIEYNRTLHRG